MGNRVDHNGGSYDRNTPNTHTVLSLSRIKNANPRSMSEMMPSYSVIAFLNRGFPT